MAESEACIPSLPAPCSPVPSSVLEAGGRSLGQENTVGSNGYTHTPSSGVCYPACTCCCTDAHVHSWKAMSHQTRSHTAEPACTRPIDSREYLRPSAGSLAGFGVLLQYPAETNTFLPAATCTRPPPSGHPTGTPTCHLTLPISPQAATGTHVATITVFPQAHVLH